ncbi:MAG: calcium/sodium antiporter [Rhodothermales bacterium]|nr:calcium/sodium antiporter [Rhodothermales bacterium]
MITDFLIFTVGLVVLYFGADWLIRGAASLALRFGIRPLVVGLTVIALGTSMPEFLVNFFAALSQQEALALGNIIGSNVCNIALILGLSSLVYPMSVSKGTLRKEYPIMMGVMLLFYLLALDGVISRIDGAVLVAGLFAFLMFVVFDARRSGVSPAVEQINDAGQEAILLRPWKKVAYLVGGILMLSLGARLMVDGATSIASNMGISPTVVGLTVVAIGTSLPELAASLVCAIKKEADMSVGNVLGSNLLNVLFVVGLVALIQPLHVDQQSLDVHFPVMLGFGVLLLPLAWTQYRITRLEGGVLLTGFVGYLTYLVYPYVA